MSTENQDRFFDLAMQKIAGHASPAELAELEGLIAADAALQEEYDRLKAESQLMTELMPMVSAIREKKESLAEQPDRFFALAMQKIAGQASDAELTELDGLIAADASLQEEYKRLAAESQLLKEALPLAEATQATEGEFPEWARPNLQLEVRETFGQPEIPIKIEHWRDEVEETIRASPMAAKPALPPQPTPAEVEDTIPAPPKLASAPPFRFGWGWGLGLAVILLVCIIPVGMWTLLPTLSSAKAKSNVIKSVNNVSQLTRIAYDYTDDNNGSLPNADVWCDMLFEEAGSTKIFASPLNPMAPARDESGKSKKVSSYTFNRALAGKEISNFPPETVLFYETTHLQWNRTGGIEDLSDPQHFHEKIAVSFIDGSARQMTLKELKLQHWAHSGFVKEQRQRINHLTPDEMDELERIMEQERLRQGTDGN